LQRQFRVLESERKTYSEEARTIITRQMNTIKSLRKENEYVTVELKLLKLQITDDKKSGTGSKKAEILREQHGTFIPGIRYLH
jgi:hypothetical protein